jgi:hypothetical protein
MFDFFSALNAAGNIGQGVAGVAGLFTANKKPAGYDEMLQGQQRSNQLAAALADPNSPLFQQIAADEQAAGRDELTRTLNQIRVQNRRATARSRNGMILTPDRRDEALASALAKGTQDESVRARQRARQVISGALTGQIGATGAARQQVGMSDALSQRRNMNRTSGVQGAFDLLGTVGRVGSRTMPSTSLGGGAPTLNYDDTVADYYRRGGDATY